MYPKAHYWFFGLFVILILGFWPSYFSPSASAATFGHHFHAIAMMTWIAMLIVQPWLISKRRRDIHRIVGRTSLIVAPLVVISALYVVMDNLKSQPQPYPPTGLSFFWLGFASAPFFAMLYILAIKNRKDVQLHARYMAATTIGFITPGLGRLLGRLGREFDIGFLNFQVALWIPIFIGAVMVFHDYRKTAPMRPAWPLATGIWAAVVVGFYHLPTYAWFGKFADWYLSFG